MGCSKNRVDSEGITQLLTEQGLTAVDRPEDARILIVNTCGFLSASRAESVGAINDLLVQKRDDQYVIAAGCMASLPNHRDEIPTGVDAILSTKEWFDIGKVVGNLLGYDSLQVPDTLDPGDPHAMLTSFDRRKTGPSAYVKVADGCDHNCHFCIIPLIKGRQISKRPSEVIREIHELVQTGTKEAILVAQDTIRYGADLGIKNGLPSLLEMIAEEVPDLAWLRLLYIYPSLLTLRLVDKMAEHEMIVPYLDMPIQHADRDVLRLMGRPSSIDMTRRLIDHARSTLAEPVMRTTLIVGHPGETEEAFQRLYDFVAEMEFDHVGVFTYSYESGTKSAALPDPVPPEVAQQRRDAIMELQQSISYKKNQALIGRTLPVLIEGVGEMEDDRGRTEPISVGRARRHAPEVDGLVFIPGELPVGTIAPVTVSEASPYDLWATPEERSTDRSRRSRDRGSRRRAAIQPGTPERLVPVRPARRAGT